MKGKWTITIERREDSGLRVWSDDFPGLVLSHVNRDAVLSDLSVAIGIFLDHLDKSEQIK